MSTPKKILLFSIYPLGLPLTEPVSLSSPAPATESSPSVPYTSRTAKTPTSFPSFGTNFTVIHTTTMLKRKRPASDGSNQSLTPDEQSVYNAIKSKTIMGISKTDLKRELTMRDRVFNNCIKSLQLKARIKEVKSVKSKKGHFMAVEFEPSNEITGGVWYSEGQLDTDFIEKLMKICLTMISRKKVATAEQVAEMVMKSGVITVKISVYQIKEIVKTLILDGEVMEVKSTGSGEYASVPAGMKCYRRARKARDDGGGIVGAMMSIPCGICPRINQCTPDGVISPITCEYYNQWLDF